VKRVLYLGYYFKQLDTARFQHFRKYVKQQLGINQLQLLLDMLMSTLKYNVSILDYFYFHFFEKKPAERAAYAGTGFMYEFQLKMNPPASRNILENKILFNEAYSPFIRRKVSTLSALKQDESLALSFLEHTSGKAVLKGSTGQVGAEVKVIEGKDFTTQQLIRFMEKNKLDLIEEYVVQHEALRTLSNSGLNTIRIFSQLDENNSVVWLGARLRITVNSMVDNMAAGNPAAPIDIETGKVCGPAVYSDITKREETHHPVTNVPIIGFQIPFWQETLEMVRKAAVLHPQNRSIGWDVAISDQGPELIEGNHNWCKLLWQLPVKKGLKVELEKYL